MRSYPSPLEVLRRHGLRPKKSWGQNFLVDPAVADAIVEAAGVAPVDTVVEIGAGPLTLTLRLADRARHVVAVERDPDLAALIRAEVGGDPRIEVLEEDALHLDLTALAARFGAPLVVVGNLPYHLAGAILVHLLDERRALARMVLMFQKEVADRILAHPGGREYGSLSVLVRQYCDVRLVRHVEPGCFFPPPRVRSSVVRFDVLPRDRHPVLDDGAFRGVVRAAFRHRRKTLRNALLAAGLPDVMGALAETGIDPSARPETLAVEGFARLADAFARRGFPPRGSPPSEATNPSTGPLELW